MPDTPTKRSRARWLVPLAILFVFVVFCGLLAFVFLGAVLSTERIARGTVLELTLKEELRESPDPLASLLPGLAGPPSLFEVRQALHRAARDENIAGLRLEVEPIAVGWAASEELRALLDDFRKTGKPVHVYLRGDMVNDVEYSLALAADRVWLAPESTLLVNGFQAEVTFWRGTLDKLHIEPQFFMMKEYKSAGEPMSRYQMSPHFREATTAVISDIWESFVDQTARRRKLEVDSVEASAAGGLMTSAEALAAKLVDAVGYEDQVREELSHAARTDEYHGLSLRKYLGRGDATEKLSTRKRMAVVFGEGIIVAAGGGGPFDSDLLHGPDVARAIRRAADDDRVKAILFRVNSPGGSAVGSDHVWRAVEYARERHKPVVVSMSSVAGSGGYWVAMGADAIVAQPSTITGSIGVVFGKLNVRGFYELIGAHVDTIKLGENADLLSSVTSLDERQTKRVLDWMTVLYEDFKAKVAKGRGLEVDAVEAIAKGRIWSGIDAKENGLVDRLGGYREALELAREKAGIPAGEEVDLVVYPKPRTLIQLLLSEDDEAGAGLGSLLEVRHPRRALARLLDELGRPGAWLMTPDVTVR